MNAVLALQNLATDHPPEGYGGPFDPGVIHSSMSFNCASDNTDE
ncbi:hypothetical protein ACFCV8_05725 [Streptomyces sp. NPDC056347]